MTPAQKAADDLHLFANGYDEDPMAGVSAVDMARWIARHPGLARIVLDNAPAFERRFDRTMAPFAGSSS